jgi:hypothetical protein
MGRLVSRGLLHAGVFVEQYEVEWNMEKLCDAPDERQRRCLVSTLQITDMRVTSEPELLGQSSLR